MHPGERGHAQQPDRNQLVNISGKPRLYHDKDFELTRSDTIRQEGDREVSFIL
jgi:hypothetical protein